MLLAPRLGSKIIFVIFEMYHINIFAEMPNRNFYKSTMADEHDRATCNIIKDAIVKKEDYTSVFCN